MGHRLHASRGRDGAPPADVSPDLHHMGLVASGNLLGRGNQSTIFARRPIARSEEDDDDPGAP